MALCLRTPFVLLSCLVVCRGEFLDVTVGAATCDTTPLRRLSMRSSIAKVLEAKGYEQRGGVFSCRGETGGSGAGNPESNTCVFDFSGRVNASKPDPIYQLGVSDIAIYIGCAPSAPGPMYYGMTSYLAAFNALDLAGLRPFGQMTDTINHVRMNSTAHIGSTSIWGTTTVFVVTADTVSARDATTALVAAGVPAVAINTMVIPSALLSLGIGLAKNYVTVGARAGPFRTVQEREEHLRTAQEPVQLFRTKSRASTAVPYPTPVRRMRGTGITEFHLNATFQKVLDGVAQWATANHWSIVDQVRLLPQLRDGVYSNGTECITNRSTAGCMGDTDDAAYFDSPPLHALTENTIDILVGANSHQTGKSVYSSAAVYTGHIGGGQSGILGGAALANFQYQGSASRFAPDADGVNQLFAVTIKYGTCGASEKWCMNATVTDTPHDLVYVTRAYLDKISGTGPWPYEMLAAVVLRLRRNTSHQGNAVVTEFTPAYVV